MSYTTGVDVSEHQGNIDWEKVKSQIAFAMIRVGYGKNNIDWQFVRNIRECNRLGIPCGAYWFSYATTAEEAKTEADYCIAALKPYKIDYPVVFDFEYDSARYAKSCGANVTKELVSAMVFAFCSEIERVGYWAMNYGNLDYLTNYFSSDTTSRFDLWLAVWPKKADPASPPRTCGIWQWGGKAYDGITGNVDSNYAYKPYQAAVQPTAAAPEVDDWRFAAVQKSLANKLLTDETWKIKANEPATVGFVCEIANRLMKGAQQ